MIAANIKQTADALKVTPECAVYLMSVVSLMRLGWATLIATTLTLIATIIGVIVTVKK